MSFLVKEEAVIEAKFNKYILYSTANTHWLKVGFQQHQCQDWGTLVAGVYCRYNHAESLHEKLWSPLLSTINICISIVPTTSSGYFLIILSSSYQMYFRIAFIQIRLDTEINSFNWCHFTLILHCSCKKININSTKKSNPIQPKTYSG